MSYLKLCQLVAQGELNEQDIPTVIYYQEDSEGNVLVNSVSYPLSIECEVIEYGSEEDYNQRKDSIAFTSETIVLAEAPVGQSIREEIFEQLQIIYPALVV